MSRGSQALRTTPKPRMPGLFCASSSDGEEPLRPPKPRPESGAGEAPCQSALVPLPLACHVTEGTLARGQQRHPGSVMQDKPKVLLVDLNNFARYPSLSIGYLASVMRNASNDVSVFAPLMVGVKGSTREKPPRWFSLLAAKLNHLAATSGLAWVRRWRDQLARRRLSGITAHHLEVVRGF